MSATIHTPFTAQRLGEELQDLASDAYLAGFNAGERVGLARVGCAFDQGLGVGVFVGAGLGAVITILILGWWP